MNHTCTATATTIDGRPPPPCPGCNAQLAEIPMLAGPSPALAHIPVAPYDTIARLRAENVLLKAAAKAGARVYEMAMASLGPPGKDFEPINPEWISARDALRAAGVLPTGGDPR